MSPDDLLAQRFEADRSRLRGVAYRILGSLAEADDAVQEAWLRLSRQSDPNEIDNLAGWLTTVVARVCLDMLRARDARREDPLDDATATAAAATAAAGAGHVRVPDMILSPASGPDPEQEALLADSLGMALLVVLETLAPAERLAFVLHDMFGVPFDEIAPIVDRSPTAARQLASRARRRVQGGSPTTSDVDLAAQREVVDAFLAAARDGDLDGLLAVLDPDIVLHADAGPDGPSRIVHGAAAVASGALGYARVARTGRHVVVNGGAGVASFGKDGLFSVLGFTIRNGRIVEIDALADPARLAKLDLTLLS